MKPIALAALVISVFMTGFLAGRLSTMGEGAASPAAPQATAPTSMPAPAPPMELPPAGGGTVSGTVAEVIQVSNYTYLRLTTSAGEQWAAVPTNTAVSVGQAVALSAQTKMENFTSKSLNRTFAAIWFGELVSAGGQASAPAAVDGLPPGHPSVAPAAAALPSVAADAVAAVQKADGALALRVADVYAEKAMLQGRAVRVRGTVKKVTSVQGRHYAHLSDGSGTAAGKDDDLLVILGSEVKADEQVSVSGTVVVNRDVGTGLVYPVALDGAVVVSAAAKP